MVEQSQSNQKKDIQTTDLTPEDPVDEDDDEEALAVVETTINGKKYLKSGDNTHEYG